MKSLWKRQPDLEQIRKFCENTAVSHLGIEILEVGPDFIKARMPVDSRTIQPAGLLHGGISVALAESLGSIASVYCNDDPSLMPVGIEINANHLRSARSGFVTGICRPIHCGRTLHVWETQIFNEDQKLLSISRLTVTLVPKERK